MNYYCKCLVKAHAFLAATLLSTVLLTPSWARAQAASPSPSAKLTSSKASDQDVLKMDPFEVVTSKDTSYGALNSNSITRFNTELYKTPVVADVFTQQFMEDTQVQTVEELFTQYGTGSGLVLATPDSDANATQPGDRFFGAQLGLRGVSAGRAHRDGFDFSPTNTNVTSTFDVERVDILHGSQGLLYGATGAGGVANITSKQAHFNQQRGSVSTRVDKYGSKSAMGDYNWGNSWVGVRLVGLKQNNNYRRLYIGDNTDGYYGQLAFKLPLGLTTSTLRIGAEETHNDRIVPNNTTVDFGGTNNDPRSGDHLSYLYDTHQLGAINPATGQPYTNIKTVTIGGVTYLPGQYNGGTIDNGNITDENYDSFAGWRTEEDVDNRIYTSFLDTNWTKWLSTSFGVLWDTSHSFKGTSIGHLTAPLVSGNPFNDWAISSNLASSKISGNKKSYRAAALFTFDFGKVAHTQTSVGFDREYSDSDGNIGLNYYTTDANGNVLSDVTKNNLGRTPLATQWWPVGGGPILYAYQKPGAKYISVNGQQYALSWSNPVSQAWVGPNNPLGFASIYEYNLNQGVNKLGTNGIGGGTGGFYNQQRRDEGWYVANYTSWLNDRFDTLFGVRESDSFTRSANTSTADLRAWREKRTGNLPSYNAGVDVRLLKWLRGYYNYSRTFNFSVGSLSPLGVNPADPTGWAHEGGFKFTNESGTISGSLSAYYTESLNDNYNAGTTFRDTVNPTGLNGSFQGPDGDKNQWAEYDKVSRGVELILTAEPTPNWRLRVSASVADGTVLKDSKYPLLYNDQFFTDGKGNVVYANGQPFMVPTNPSGVKVGSKTGLNNQSTPVDPTTLTGGGTMEQLTVAMLNDINSPYYAFGQGTAAASQPLNGSIGGPTGGTAASQVYVKNALQWFRFGSATGPSALTGVTGLPISAIQYNWADPGGYQGQYIAQKKGNYTVGYPVYATNIETNYTFSQGPIKGFGLGGTLGLAWYYRSFYFATKDRAQHLYSQPIMNPQVNLFFSYTHKFRRVTFHTQLNIQNLFNRYVISISPNNGTGYAQMSNVNGVMYGQPRNYVWSTKFDF